MTTSTYCGFLPLNSDGNAKIKQEFMIVKHKNEDPCEKLNSQIEDTGDNPRDKPQKKARGQNRNRPRPAKEDFTRKLCPSKITKSGACFYGEKCKHMHDIDAFMKIKPKDLGHECISFQKRGLCPYSFACRFGNDHIIYTKEKGYENVINEELMSKNLFAIANVISRNLQVTLRKRKFDFSKTNEALKVLEEQKRIKMEKCETTAIEKKDVYDVYGENENSAMDKTNDLKETISDKSIKTSNILVSNGNEHNDVVELDKLNSRTSISDAFILKAKAEPDVVNKDCTTKLLSEDSNASSNLAFDQFQNYSTFDTSRDTATALISVDRQMDTLGCVTDEDVVSLRVEEKRNLDFSNRLYLAPLTTCGNLPFRVVCKRLGADITCGEMALSTSLLQGQTSEWALVKRHKCEDIFGVQVCGAFPDTMGRCAELLDKFCEIDFIDVNLGCPIDLVYKKGAGSALMRRTNRLYDIITTMNRVISVPLTCKLRTGIETNKNTAHSLMKMMRDNGVALATLHGRSREARYTRVADWQYIDHCARAASPMPVFGNGDIFSHHDYYSALENTSISGIMIARGALIKPWIFTEIKERKDWDISSSERFDIIKGFVNEGLMHWGSDNRGIEITRRFLLEWCSFLHRYIPLGILERVPQRINERPPYYVGRNDLETLMASPNANDWVKLSEMLLGPVPDSFTFLPKHKANAYK